MTAARSSFDDLAGLHELCRLRSTLEGFAAVRLREHSRREEVLDDFDRRLQLMQVWARQGRLDAFRLEDVELHRALVTSCGTGALLHCWEHVNAELEAWIRHVQEVYWPSLMTLYREHEFLDWPDLTNGMIGMEHFFQEVRAGLLERHPALPGQEVVLAQGHRPGHNPSARGGQS